MLPLHSLVLFVVVLAVACAAFDPARRTLLLGQINLILCAVILLDIARREGRWRGLAVGVAAGIKLTPLFFIAFLLVTRQWAAARNLVLGFVGTVLIGFALMPRSSWTYWTRIAGDAERIGPPFRFSNQSINGLLHRSSVVPESWTGPLWVVLSVVVGGLILVLAKHFWEHDRAVTAVAMAGIAMTLVSPFSWTHHWVWALPLGLSLISSETTGGDWTCWRAASCWCSWCGSCGGHRTRKVTSSVGVWPRRSSGTPGSSRRWRSLP